MNRLLLAVAGLALFAACSPAPTPTPVASASPEATPTAVPEKDILLSGVGIGVSDLMASTKFYTEVLGMERMRSYRLAEMDEEVVGYPNAESFIILMHWKDGSKRNYKNLPVKVVTRVKDPVAAFERIKAAGMKVIREPKADDKGVFGAGLAYDPDGYVLEILPQRKPGWNTPALLPDPTPVVPQQK